MEEFDFLVSKNEVLKKLFAHCPEDIKMNQTIELFPKGSTLIEKGKEINSVFILLSGGFDVFKEDDKYNNLTFLSNQAPAFAGVLEAISGHKIANASVRTNSESIVVIYSLKDFKSWIESDFSTYKLIFTIFTQDMYHNLSEKFEFNSQHGKNFIMNYLSTTYRNDILLNGEIIIAYSSEILSKNLNMHEDSFKNNIEWLLRDHLISMAEDKIIINKQQLGRIESFLIHNSQR
ncbi:MAG: cyclic nucleotide-binding domain-containing protein [Spirochaetaceae bacterium]|nr:cyclic nucleotide-binding domain-containing protein [Spirochaetaceae bacterium]